MNHKRIILPLLLLGLTACHTDPFSVKPEVPIDPDKVKPAPEKADDTAAIENGSVQIAQFQRVASSAQR